MPDDRDVEDLLRSALERDVRTGAVDESALTTGTRTRIRRLHRRRRVTWAVATLAALAAVPLTVQALPDGAVRTRPAASATATEPEPTAATADPTASTPTATPRGTPATAPGVPMTPLPAAPLPATPLPTTAPADPDAVAYDVPDLPGLVAALPAGQVLLLDLGQYAKNPTVSGQACGGSEIEPPQIAGRQWGYAEEDSNRLDQTSVDVVVTGWAPGTGPGAFGHLVANDSRTCGFSDDLTRRTVDVPGADETWAARWQTDGTPVTAGAARAGDLVVGVTVSNPGPEGDADVARVLTAAVADLRGSGLAATGS
ncbi:hypothetical protein MO973_41145 [Paenibacillus sp. TRM 82003]|uniref:hypothetical protein n=1 Tax=Kineococcus sp. TRM81007 TaxID=2925831 RepID=UPI001F5A3EE5|nr:hypothetical protein [Kineococcus sp. TRM81007]MCI2237003.1 hypothetical protein [Kineococcus sp. TRM81007]MCI3926602.1 hypothetical protein [Paenibacillus sp. TRM 82003]